MVLDNCALARRHMQELHTGAVNAAHGMRIHSVEDEGSVSMLKLIGKRWPQRSLTLRSLRDCPEDGVQLQVVGALTAHLDVARPWSRGSAARHAVTAHLVQIYTGMRRSHEINTKVD